MPCLIAHQNNVPTIALITNLIEATNVLYRAASVHNMQPAQQDRHWASRWKRQTVTVEEPRVEDPHIVRPGEHDFSEVLNQSANVARLIDVLEWVLAEHAAEHVRSCDPTQSSGGLVDLVAESADTLFLFEITDTCGSGFPAKMRRQTRKLETAINSFRILFEGKVIESFHVAGDNERVSMARGWIPIGNAGTAIRRHPHQQRLHHQREQRGSTSESGHPER